MEARSELKQKLKVVLFSDTHDKHDFLDLEGSFDIALFAGDAGTYKDPHRNKAGLLRFIDWYSGLANIRHKVWIAGNHCTSIEAGLVDAKALSLQKGLIYLEHESVQVEGLKIFGSPYTPRFGNGWAFNADRGESIRELWSQIPDDTDIIVAHGPAGQILDQAVYNGSVGCEDLAKRVKEISPLCFVCGHIHEAYGYELQGQTHYFNVSVLNVEYELFNRPRIIEISTDKTLSVIQ